MRRLFMASFCLMLTVLIIAFTGGDSRVTNEVPQAHFKERCLTLLLSPLDVYRYSEAIIVGKVTKTQPRHYHIEDWSDRTELYTVSTIKVSECLKGNLKAGDKVRMLQWGNGNEYISEYVLDSGGYLKKGDCVFLFLEKSNTSWFESKNKEKEPYGVNEIGEYKLDKNGTILTKVSHLFSDDCHTLSDLKNKVHELAKEAAQKAASSRLAAAASSKK